MTAVGPAFSFRERMEGVVQRPGERFDRSLRFDLDVRAPSLLDMLVATALGEAEGTLHLDGLARRARAEGRIEMSPVRRQALRYVLDFEGDDGKAYRFEGTKHVPLRAHLVGWTTLPGCVMDATGAVWGEALLRFSLRRELGQLARSFRVTSGQRLLA
jgi:hypothetical protein